MANPKAKAREIARQLLDNQRPPAHEAPRPATRLSADEPPLPSFERRRAIHFIRWYEGVLRAHGAVADTIARVGTGAAASRDDDDLSQAVIDMHRMLLNHPIAAKAAFRALVQEGRRYGQTAEGAALRRRLLASPRLSRTNLLFRTLSMGMLAADESTTLPSAYLDTLMSLVDGGDVERMIAQLLSQKAAATPRAERHTDVEPVQPAVTREAQGS